MMKTKYYILSLLLGLLLLGASGCQDVMETLVKAPDPYIENIVQGHEQIYSIKAICRLRQRQGVKRREAGGELVRLRPLSPQ